MKDYKPNIYAPKRKFKVKKITGEDVKRSCQSAKASVAGLDNWEPAEFALLSLSTCDWLAELLNLIEAGSPWPEGLQHSKAAYLAKDEKKTD